MERDVRIIWSKCNCLCQATTKYHHSIWFSVKVQYLNWVCQSQRPFPDLDQKLQIWLQNRTKGPTYNVLSDAQKYWFPFPRLQTVMQCWSCIPKGHHFPHWGEIPEWGGVSTSVPTFLICRLHLVMHVAVCYSSLMNRVPYDQSCWQWCCDSWG